LTPNELVLRFVGSDVCTNFGKNRSRNATVRVLADGQTDTHTETQTDFIICPMLYAIAMGQIITADQCVLVPRRVCQSRSCVSSAPRKYRVSSTDRFCSKL